MKTKRITQSVLVLLILVATLSCSKDTSIPSAISTGNVALKAKATINNVTLKNSLAQKKQAAITITNFKVNIKKIEFDIKDNDTINDDLYTDIKLNGPFELDLASGSTSIDITTVDLPNNVYDKIQFELDKSLNNQSDLFGKSIEIKGDIDGVPFIFWSDAEDEIKVDFSNKNIDVVVDGSTTTTTINFDLSAIFGATTTLDFSTATDGNGNGIIEINPTNIDGNGELAGILKDLIENGSDLENDTTESGSD